MKEMNWPFSKEEYGINKYSIGIEKKNQKYCYQVKENEIYDIASITKLFTLKLLYDLQREGKIDFNATVTSYLELPNLDKTTILDLIKMKDTIRTNGKLSDAKNQKEFLTILSSVKVEKSNMPEYNDIGFCLLGLLIEKVTHKSLAVNFQELFQKLKLDHTRTNPDQDVKVYGNGRSGYFPHDKKTRIAGGVTGASGIFSNVTDLLRVGKLLIEGQFFDKEFLSDIFKYNFVDHKKRNRTYAGLYKYTDNYKCYVPKDYSKKSLAHQGYTGATLIVDLKKQIVNVALFDAISKKTDEKKDNFFDGYDELQEIISKETLDLKEGK